VINPQKIFVKNGILISKITGLYNRDINKPNQKEAQTEHNKGLLRIVIFAVISLKGFIISE
jgi:hypothetical protein